MIESMTGYGKAEAILKAGKIIIEIRSLNSKSADISLKSQIIPREKDLAVRQKIADTLYRGTIDVYVNFEPAESGMEKPLNEEFIRQTYSHLREIRSSLPGFGDGAVADDSALLGAVLRMPEAYAVHKQDIITEEEWPLVEKAIDSALESLVSYRKEEGKALYRDVTSRVKTILELEDEVESCEAERLAAVKERLARNAAELALKLDEGRFEQEMVYYLEKLDINEEKVRLRQHCKYFLDTIDSERYPGKKLGFIIQEMGREINTTGSKANHARIQKAVVKMKDELEKIREQSLNIL